MLFKKEQRRIGWYEMIPRNIASAYLYFLAVILFLEGCGQGCLQISGKMCFFRLLGISVETIQMIPKEHCGLIHIGVGLMAFIMAHRISVRKVCAYCHLNRGVRKVGTELIHVGNWVPVETSNGSIRYEQENMYKYTYECKECGEGYTTTGTEVRRK